MTQSTPRAALPELAAAQAQKHVTHNEALLQLDALLNARILDRDLSAPPASPADGDTYLVKAAGSGAWAGQGGKLAFAVDGAWRFYAPFVGLAAFVADESVMLVYTATGWKDWASIVNLQNVPLVGVNTAADATNKFAIRSNAALFAALEAANGGNGDMRIVNNKVAAGNTASLLFQDNFSGRAEIGLAGDDNFHFKVSPDGVTWNNAITITAATGSLGVGVLSPITNSTVKFQVEGSDANAVQMVFKNGATIGTNPQLAFVQAGSAAFGISRWPNAGILEASSSGGLVLSAFQNDITFQTNNRTTQAVIQNATGNVGIGTTSPASLLNISGNNSNTSYLRIDYTTTNVGTILGSNATEGFMGTISNHPFVMRTNNVDNLFIDTAGNVGIGTTSPSGKLDVNSDHIRVRTAKTPATSAAAGNAGDIAWDANFVYVCIATNAWKRAALASW